MAMIPLDPQRRTDVRHGRRDAWIPLIVTVVLIATAYVLGAAPRRADRPSPALTTSSATVPSRSINPATLPEPESAGGPASSTRQPAPSVDPGASPSVSPRPAAAAVTTLGSARSPVEQSPGYFPPDDPESMSVITGRRAAPRVDGEFEGGAPTFETLLQAALVAIERGDETALHSLRVTRAEFKRFVWRELPQSRPVTNIRAGDAWSFISSGSLAGASRAVAALGGRRFTIVNVASSGPLEYTNFTLWRDIALRARDESSGEFLTLRFLPAVVERRGRFKVFSFKD